MKLLKKLSIGLVVILLLAYGAGRIFGPKAIDSKLNPFLEYNASPISAEPQAFHDSLTIMDWHADSLLWNRDFLKRNDYGLVDLPRLKEGNISIQMLTTVTKSPSGQNVHSNNADTFDNITMLAAIQGWPLSTINSLLERALYQSDKLTDYVVASEGQLAWIRNQKDFKTYLNSNGGSVAVLLGTEGSHPLESNINNIDRMYNAGFRMFGLTHFFDNALGGSLHGTSKAGLTDFGKAAVKRFDELEIIIDLAHASEEMAYDVLSLSNRPPVVSHTGLKGACDTPRNFSDDLMKAIAAKGGLIAIGFWETAVCDPTPAGIAKTIKYGIELVGADHIALGSDWDGSVQAIPSNMVPHITAELLKLNVSKEDIRKVMGGNSIAFLQTWLPKD
ncbi:dipeptidase [Kordiimonas laminariae]|uniref:dipeptidase n=1 Tax=Kordiimonas laminariae TaxID=2917717 RepID=UPI001FF6AC0C|nr:membrane dipeptidase [Kordiimonas laminariae]MCK0068685.1 membrane dipeptidase [Kordiimonas laminariae]